MITQTSAICKFLEQIQLLHRTFGAHLKGSPAEHHSVEKVIKALEGISWFCTSWLADIRSYTDKIGVVKGPEGIISSNTMASIKMMLRSAKELKRTISYISPEFVKHVKPSAMLTLVFEHLFSKMRARNDTPTVLEFAYLFGHTI